MPNSPGLLLSCVCLAGSSVVRRLIAAVAIAICHPSVWCSFDIDLALMYPKPEGASGCLATPSSMLHLVQGAGGMVMIDPAFQRAMAQHCQEHNIPVILDEVFSGIWRLGHLSAAEMLGIKPDIACYAKLLTGRAAVLVSAWRLVSYTEVLVSYTEVHNVVTLKTRFLLVADAHNSFDLFQTLPYHVHDVCVLYSFKLAVHRSPVECQCMCP